MQPTQERGVESSSTPQVVDQDAPPFEFGAGLGRAFGRDGEQLRRDAEAASLTDGAN